MNDPAWCRAQLDQMDDRLRRIAHSDGRFADVLEEMRLFWNDAAARETFGRYLDPYRTESVKTLQHLTEQLTRLRDVVARMDEAEKPAAEILVFSEEVARLRELAQIEIQNAHHRVDLALDEAAIAQSHAEHAEQIIAGI